MLGIWVVLEWRVRLRSHFNRNGSRLDRGSLFVVLALVVVSLGAAFALAGDVHAAAIAEGGSRSSSPGLS
jgi:hypothetical protein